MAVRSANTAFYNHKFAPGPTQKSNHWQNKPSHSSTHKNHQDLSRSIKECSESCNQCMDACHENALKILAFVVLFFISCIAFSLGIGYGIYKAFVSLGVYKPLSFALGILGTGIPIGICYARELINRSYTRKESKSTNSI